MPLNMGQKVRRVGRRDILQGEMTANVQIGWVFPFLNDLMMYPSFPNRLLLGVNILGESFVLTLKFRPHSLDCLLDNGQFSVCRAQLFLCSLAGVGATQ